MSERKTSQELNEIMKKLNVSELWSWSRYNAYKTDKYGFFLKYIKKIPENRRDSIYGVSGGYCHDIIEKYYNGSINHEDMITEYEDSLLTMNLAEYKYDRNDEDKNLAIGNKYENCIKHFFKNHYKPDNINMILEMFCTAKVSDDIVFQGYIDNCGVYLDNNKEKRIMITDYKTSTIYKGEKLEKESGQLYLYAEAIRQKTKLPLDHISIRYLFLKYVTIHYQQANGIWKEQNVERTAIGEKALPKVVMWLTKLGYDPEQYRDNIMLFNSIDDIPDDVKEKIYITDCYVYLPLSEEHIDNLKSDIIETVTEIRQKTSEYEKTQDEKLFWTEVNEKNEYFLSVLSGYSRELHKPFDEYLKAKEMYETKEKDNENDDMDDLLGLLDEL